MFDDALDYVIKYLSDKARAANNEQPAVWFTDGVDSYAALIDEVFNTDEANTDLAGLYTEEALATGDLITAHARLDALLGMQRDVRVAFAAGAEHDPFTAGDTDRHAHIQALYLARRFKQVKSLLGDDTVRQRRNHVEVVEEA